MGVQVWRPRRQFDRFNSLLCQHAKKFSRVQRIPIMKQIAFSFEESINFIRDITSNLRHPKAIGSACDSADLDAARRKVYEEEDDKPFQAGRGPHFDREEVASHDLLPVAIEELLPRCLAAPFGSRLDAIPFQDIRNRVVSQQMPQIA